MPGWGPITAGRDAGVGTHHCGQVLHGPVPLLAWGECNWEQPLGFGLTSSSSLPPSSRFPPQVLDYDYYGAYGQERHRDYTYNRLLGDEYTFDFPPHHDIVSVGGQPPPAAKTAGHIWSRGG